MNFLLVMVSLIGVVWPNSFTVVDYSVSPSTAKAQDATYSFQFGTVSAFVRNFDLHIVFPTANYDLQPVTNCQFQINSSPVSSAVCAVDSGTSSIIFSNLQLTQTITSMSISFNTITANYAGSATLAFNYYEPGTNTLINNLINFISVTTTNAPLTTIISTTSDIVGSGTTYTIQYTPSVTISQNSIVQVEIQPWGAYSQSNFITTNTTTICSGECTLTVPSDTNNVT